MGLASRLVSHPLDLSGKVAVVKIVEDVPVVDLLHVIEHLICHLIFGWLFWLWLYLLWRLLRLLNLVVADLFDSPMVTSFHGPLLVFLLGNKLHCLGLLPLRLLPDLPAIYIRTALVVLVVKIMSVFVFVLLVDAGVLLFEVLVEAVRAGVLFKAVLHITGVYLLRIAAGLVLECMRWLLGSAVHAPLEVVLLPFDSPQIALQFVYTLLGEETPKDDAQQLPIF